MIVGPDVTSESGWDACVDVKRSHVFYTTYFFAATDMIDHSYLSLCPCYGDYVREGLKHILLICNRCNNQIFLLLCGLISRY